MNELMLTDALFSPTASAHDIASGDNGGCDFLIRFTTHLWRERRQNWQDGHGGQDESEY
jgi:hypothetical protein